MKNVNKTLIAAGLLAFSFNASAATMTLNGGTIDASLDCETHQWCWDGSDPDVGAYFGDNSNFFAGDIQTITGFINVVEVEKDEDPYTGGLVFDVGVTSDLFYVKDGANDPKWYIFDINTIANTVPGWDGTVTLTGTWFGVGEGDAISHVSWYTDDSTDRGLCNPQIDDCGPSAVPIPASVYLMGTGLLGLVGVARRNPKV